MMAPKHIFCGAKIVEIATKIAACIFNDGFATVLKIMEVLNIKIGESALKFGEKRDNARIYRAERRSTEASQKARSARRDARMEENDAYEEVEGILYGAGIDDDM